MKVKKVICFTLSFLWVFSGVFAQNAYDYTINTDDAVFSVTFKANQNGDYKVYQGRAGSNVLASTATAAAIETILPSDESELNYQIGAKTRALNALPYQRFVVNYHEETPDTNLKVNAEATSYTGEKLGLYAYNHVNKSWDLLDAKIVEEDYDKVVSAHMSATVNTKKYGRHGVVDFVIAPALVNNHAKSIFWLTDTQYYTRLITSHLGIYETMTQYAKDLYEKGEVGYVVHTGDIVNIPTFREQYYVADEAQRILDNAYVPNGVVSGNHDVGHSPDTLNYTLFKEYFGRKRYQDKLWFGGDYDDNTNSYHLVTINERDFVIIYIGMGLENTPETIAWANDVLTQYRHRNAIIALHEYIDGDGNYVNDRAEDVFSKIAKPNDNVGLVLCGHIDAVKRNVLTIPGRERPLVEMLSDYQSLAPEENGGNGYVRVMTFENDQLHNVTYSPYLKDYNKFDTTPELLDQEAFTIEYKLQDALRYVTTLRFDVIEGGEVLFNDEVMAIETFNVIPTDKQGQLVVEVTSNGKTEKSYVDLSSVPEQQVDSTDAKYPKQVVVHVSEHADRMMYVTWTTLKEAETVLTLKKDNGKPMNYKGKHYWHMGKYFHQVILSDLEADCRYWYKIGQDKAYTNGTFKTMASATSQEPMTFYYIADPQVAKADDAEAAGAVFDILNGKNPDLVYMAGDITDSALNEKQWEKLFNNTGAFPNGGENLMKSSAISVAVGNHDIDTFSEHIKVPNEEMPGVYDIDNGPLKLIVLNTNYFDPISLTRQRRFLKNKVAEAKAQGQWAAVGFHKSIYSGAGHIDDLDVKAIRKKWAPILADVDVDVVLQGHDHVYARGFVDRFGQGIDQIEQGYMKNVPLYITGGHGGGLKWYSKSNYKVSKGDLLEPNYQFLDVNSADYNGEKLKEQTYIKVIVSTSTMQIMTYMFKYDPKSDTIVKQPYLFDSIIMEK